MIEIDDDEMKLLGKRIKDNLFFYDGKILRMFETHPVENYSYYVEDKG